MKERIPQVHKYEEDENVSNIIRTLVLDPLYRDKELSNFIKNLSSMGEKNRIIAVNGRWGSGKTFFLKQFQILCNYHANKLENAEKVEALITEYEKDKDASQHAINYWKIVRSDCKEFVEEECCEVLYFNAWECDSDIDPMKSLMYYLIEQYHLPYNKIIINWKNLGKTILKYITKIDYGDDLISWEHIFDGVITNRDIKKMWASLLDECICEKCNRLYIIIDDLDRSRPEYAMKMLERLKHYADDPRVTFLLAIDYDEMADMIEHFYGYRKSGECFLDKVVDKYIELDERQYADYKSYLGNCITGTGKINRETEILELTKMTAGYLFEDKHMTLREMAKCCETIEYMSSFCNAYIGQTSGELGNTIIKGIVLPYAQVLNILNKKEYYAFIRGEGQNEFLEFLARHEDLYNNLWIEADNVMEVFEKVYQFVVCVMGKDKLFVKSQDIKNVRIYEDSISESFECINNMHDYEMGYVES